MSTPTAVIPATLEDANTIADILGEAFYDDPVVGHVLGRAGLARELFKASFQYVYAPLEQSFYVTNDAGQAMGCALWVKPGQTPGAAILPLLKLGWVLLKLSGRKGFIRGIKIAEFLEANHLEEPHYYLHAIGVKSAFQGQGVGGYLLSHGLAMADRDQMPAFLENSKERNVPIYQKYGFEVIRQKYLPEDGPPIWFMRREPQKPQKTI